MLNNVKQYMITYPSGYSNWGMLLLDNVSEFFEVAIVGKNANKKPHNWRTRRLKQFGGCFLKLTLESGSHASDPDQEKIEASNDPEDSEYG